MGRTTKTICDAKRKYTWADGKELEIGGKTLIMGILNVTPDSFSDGGKWNSVDKAVQHMLEMVVNGADIIDIGAESSRPGFVTMSAREEIERLKPFLEAVVPACPVPVSIDTFKSETAAFAAEHGVHILNDIWGLQYEEEPGEMAQVAAKYDLPVVVMHNRNYKEYKGDIIDSMRAFFMKSIDIAEKAGVSYDKLILDPGIGFGKTVEGNLEVNESLLTGEADNLVKNNGDDLYSGSFVTAGEAYCQVTHVGADNYASRITSEAKEFKRHNSELRNSLNAILKIISIIIVPLGFLLFYKQFLYREMVFLE